MINEDSYIAVFDSGIGGISVLRELVQQMPREHFLYFGDSHNAPYGTRTTDEVRALTLQHIDTLMGRGLKAVVIACNTATSAAIIQLRQQYPDHIIIGIEPALKLAAERFPGGRIVVMATDVTLRERKFAQLMVQYQDTHDIVRLPCAELVEFIERGETSSPALEAYLHRLLSPHLAQKTDAIVLGCTHFPLARTTVAKVAGSSVAILDGGEGTARETRRRLAEAGLLRTEGKGSITFENSSDDAALPMRCNDLLNKDI